MVLCSVLVSPGRGGGKSFTRDAGPGTEWIGYWTSKEKGAQSASASWRADDFSSGYLFGESVYILLFELTGYTHTVRLRQVVFVDFVEPFLFWYGEGSHSHRPGQRSTTELCPQRGIVRFIYFFPFFEGGGVPKASGSHSRGVLLSESDRCRFCLFLMPAIKANQLELHHRALTKSLGFGAFFFF